jgi:hypothetical protein
VKPFNYYHTHVAPFREGTALAPSLKDVRNLAEVTVRSRFGGLRAYSEKFPAMVVDAYQAFNDCADAGFTPAWFAGPNNFTLWLQRLYVGDMNEYRHYLTGNGYSGLGQYSFGPNNGFANWGWGPTIPEGGFSHATPFSRAYNSAPLQRGVNSRYGTSLTGSWESGLNGGVAGRWSWHDPADVAWAGGYPMGYGEDTNIGHYTRGNFPLWSSGMTPINQAEARQKLWQASLLGNLHYVKLITDYNPRQEGHKHYKGANQPTVNISLLPFEDGLTRPTYRDRHYVMQGFSVCEEFYQPNYSKRPLPEVKDYRRTLYWNPFLRLDQDGEAEVSFYNNGKPTTITVSAEGISRKGQIVTGISYPEDR